MNKRYKRTGKNGNPIGRPPGAKNKAKYIPGANDKAFVNAWRIMGLSPEKIARMLGVGPEALYDHFGREMEFAAARADAMVVANLFRQITKDDFRAIPGAVRWVQLRLKWGEGKGGSNFGKPAVMRLHILNDPEAGLDQFRDVDEGLGGTIEVSGHEPSSPFVDPFDGKFDLPGDESKK